MVKGISPVLKQLLIAVLVFSSLSLTPWWTVDALNLPKFVVIISIGFTIFLLAITNVHTLDYRKYKNLLIVLALFDSWLVIVLFFSGSGISEQFFGAPGRNTGFLTYFALSFLLFAAAVVSDPLITESFIRVLIFIGLISCAYGLLQIYGKDPISWSNVHSPVVGFVGNPDFQSSLLGLIAILALSSAISPGITIGLRIMLLIFVLASLFEIYKTNAIQGFLVFAFGLLTYCHILFYEKYGRRIGISSFLLTVPFVTLAFLGMLNKGPLSSLLYKPSITYRGDYWRAGWEMTRSHPLFGVGLEGYGDWYRRSRTIEATIRRGPEIVSTSAHNVVLDLLSGGGFLLGFLYVVIIIFTLLSAFRIIGRSRALDPHIAIIFSAWIGYQSQSMVSINQLSLATIGWTLSGLIIGYEINTRPPKALVPKKNNLSFKNNRVLDVKLSKTRIIVLTCVGLCVGSLIALPPFYNSVKFKQSIQNGNVKELTESALATPLDLRRMTSVALNFRDNHLDELSLNIMRRAITEFPDSFDAWKVYSEIIGISNSQKAQAVAEMKRLDPHNPDLK